MPTFTTTLDDILNIYGSDKGSAFSPGGHAYSFIYDRFFDSFRNDAFTLVEIGLDRGNHVGVQEGLRESSTVMPSVDAWLQYFPRSSIIGFDITDFSLVSKERFTFLRGDASNPSDLHRLATAAGSPQLIIDDGSHASYHQILSFCILFPILKPGGIYIIEDVHWQPPVYERQLPPSPKVIEVFQSLQLSGVYPPPVSRRLKLARALRLVETPRPLPVDNFDEQTALIDYINILTRTQNDKAIVIYKRV